MTDTRSARFRYALEPFLRKKKLDCSGATLQEARAKTTLDRQTERAAKIKSEIEAIERSLREACAPGAAIDRDRQRNISDYLKHAQRGLTAARREVEDANAVHDRVSREANALRQGIKALEKHRSGKQAEHAVEIRRREYNQLDELWLMNTNYRTTAAINRTAAKPRSSTHRQPSKGDKNGR